MVASLRELFMAKAAGSQNRALSQTQNLPANTLMDIIEAHERQRKDPKSRPTGLTLMSLPNELRFLILESTPLPDLLNLALSCKTFYAAFQRIKPYMGYKLLRAICPPMLISTAIAHHVADTVPWKPSTADGYLDNSYVANVDCFAEQYLDQRSITFPILKLSFEQSVDILHFNTRIVEAARNIGAHALKNGKLPLRIRNQPLSEREVCRIAKALYILDTMRQLLLLPPDGGAIEPHSYHDQAMDAFWKRFAPWQYDQVRDVVSLATQVLTVGQYSPCPVRRSGYLTQVPSGKALLEHGARVLFPENVALRRGVFACPISDSTLLGNISRRVERLWLGEAIENPAEGRIQGSVQQMTDKISTVIREWGTPSDGDDDSGPRSAWLGQFRARLYTRIGRDAIWDSPVSVNPAGERVPGALFWNRKRLV